VKRKIPSPNPQESNPRTPIVQTVAQRYTDWAITALKLNWKTWIISSLILSRVYVYRLILSKVRTNIFPGKRPTVLQNREDVLIGLTDLEKKQRFRKQKATTG
jgi:hypothetical protein